MRWLLSLVARPGFTILDPFAGSGSTGVAALELGMNFVGSEQGGKDDRYLPILVGRIRSALGLEPDLTIAQPVPDAAPTEQPGDETGSEE